MQIMNRVTCDSRDIKYIHYIFNTHLGKLNYPEHLHQPAAAAGLNLPYVHKIQLWQQQPRHGIAAGHRAQRLEANKPAAH